MAMTSRRIIEQGSRLDGKPDRDNYQSDHDPAPHGRRSSFRAAAARRVGMVEFAGPVRLHENPVWFRGLGARTRVKSLIRGHLRLLSRSGFEGVGWVTATGSDAGKVSIRPASSFAWVSLSACAALRGSSASLSCGAGSNFLAM